MHPGELRPYQQRALTWMQAREDDGKQQLHPLWKAHELPGGDVIYAHATEGTLSCHMPWLRLNVRVLAAHVL